jgi:holliday junction DNA helicase RuvA
MYDHIQGKLLALSAEEAVVFVNGLGFKLHVPSNAIGLAPSIGNTVTFYTSLVVREDSHKLFGFPTLEERALFEKLTTISGIGPKTALGIVGHISVEELRLALDSADVKLLSKLPGIGKKTAERLIIEMRGKLPHGTALKNHDHVVADGINALINLGYNTLQAQKVIRTAFESFSSPPSLKELISTALKIRS